MIPLLFNPSYELSTSNLRNFVELVSRLLTVEMLVTGWILLSSTLWILVLSFELSGHIKSLVSFMPRLERILDSMLCLLSFCSMSYFISFEGVVA